MIAIRMGVQGSTQHGGAVQASSPRTPRGGDTCPHARTTRTRPPAASSTVPSLDLGKRCFPAPSRHLCARKPCHCCRRRRNSIRTHGPTRIASISYRAASSQGRPRTRPQVTLARATPRADRRLSGVTQGGTGGGRGGRGERGREGGEEGEVGKG